MRITRSGSQRWHGETVVFEGKPSEINDLEITLYNVRDLNSSRTQHDYTVRITDEELDQLLDERLKRFRRDILARIVEPTDDERLRELLDQYACWYAASSRSRPMVSAARTKDPSKQRS